MNSVTLRPIAAFKAARNLIRDPESTEEVFRLFGSLSNRNRPRLHARFKASTDGRRLLAERPALVQTLADRAALEAMPADSLGRAYLAHCDREGITADGLIEASAASNRQFDDDAQRYIIDRLRDSHDIWHVMTGCQTDLFGETALLAFSAAQTRGLGVRILAVLSYGLSLRYPRHLSRPARRMARECYMLGQRAKWLPTVHWESLLPRPLAEVREQLGIEPVGPYSPLYQSDVERLAL